jgi:hypothetical protein
MKVIAISHPGYLNAKRQAIEAFADAVCNCPDSDCGGAESKFYETEHKECRAALLKECGLGE